MTEILTIQQDPTPISVNPRHPLTITAIAAPVSCASAPGVEPSFLDEIEPGESKTFTADLLASSKSAVVLLDRVGAV